MGLEEDRFTSASINPWNIISWLILSCWVHLLYRLNSTLCYCLQPDVTLLLGHMTPFSDISIHQAYKGIYVKTSSSKDANGKILGKCFPLYRKSRKNPRHTYIFSVPLSGIFLVRKKISSESLDMRHTHTDTIEKGALFLFDTKSSTFSHHYWYSLQFKILWICLHIICVSEHT